MKVISLASLPTLTAKSERTLWRWISDGTLVRFRDESSQLKTMVYLDSVIPHLCISLQHDEMDLIESADIGYAEAQNDLALLFLGQDKPESALYWLNLAAKQDYSESMHWLGRCYIEGKGVTQDENLGIMWLAKAAAYGHAISQAQIQAMRDGFVKKGQTFLPDPFIG